VNWEPLNLAHLDQRPPVEPTLGGVGLVYPGKRHVVSGPQESAKTLAAYAIALETIRQAGTVHGTVHGTVLLIDFEMGPYDARDRFRELGANDTDLDRLLYVEPETPATAETAFALVELNPTLVIVDAAAGAYDLQGLDDNKRSDVERFAGTYVRTFWLRGVATILIDHVVKNADQRGKYAIGSERKIGGADVHLGFEPITALTRGGYGLYRVATHKDRLGHLPRPRAAELELRSDPVTHAITWAFKPPTNGVDAEADDPPCSWSVCPATWNGSRRPPVATRSRQGSRARRSSFGSRPTASSARASQPRNRALADRGNSSQRDRSGKSTSSRPRPSTATSTSSRPRPSNFRRAKPNLRPRPTSSRPRPSSRNRPRPTSVSPLKGGRGGGTKSLVP
jgi:AAA domain-containing protein